MKTSTTASPPSVVKIWWSYILPGHPGVPLRCSCNGSKNSATSRRRKNAAERTLVGIDLGGKRTGLAFAETLSGLVMPIEVLHANEGPELDSALDHAIREHGPHRLVIGLPPQYGWHRGTRRPKKSSDG